MQKSESRYLRVKRFILDGIRSQQWKPGQQVPSENELVGLCNVSRMTARRALEELDAEGVLFRIRGKGSFVAEEKHQSSLLEIKNIKQEIQSQGSDYQVTLIELSEIQPTEALKELFSINDNSKIFHSIMIHFQDKSPIQVEERFVNPAGAKNYLAQDFKSLTPNEYLTQVAPITQAEHIIEAINPEKQIHQLLQLESDEAALLLTRTTWSGDCAISYAKLYHPGKRYRLQSQFKLDGLS